MTITAIVSLETSFIIQDFKETLIYFYSPLEQKKNVSTLKTI